VFDVIGSSSALQALRLTCSIGMKSKIKSAFFLDSYRVVLLRYCMLMRKMVVPNVAGSVVAYVILRSTEFVVIARDTYMSGYRLMSTSLLRWLGDACIFGNDLLDIAGY
jgi:uncharacterized membrane protein (GlpM family)